MTTKNTTKKIIDPSTPKEWVKVSSLKVGDIIKLTGVISEIKVIEDYKFDRKITLTKRYSANGSHRSWVCPKDGLISLYILD